MRSEEIENAYPGLTPLLVQARLEFGAGRIPYEICPALLGALARAVPAGGLTSLGQLPAGQLRELLERCGGSELLEKWGADDAGLQRAHLRLAALSGCELLALLNFHENACNEGLTGKTPQAPKLIPSYFTYALDAYLGAAQLQGGQVLICDAIAHGPALLRLVRRHPQVSFTLVVESNSPGGPSEDYYCVAALVYQDCPHVRLYSYSAPRIPASAPPQTIWPPPGSWDLIVPLPRGMFGRAPRGVSPEFLLSVAGLGEYIRELSPDGRLITAVPERLAGSSAASYAALRIHLSASMSLHELCELPAVCRFDIDDRHRRAILMVLGAADAPPSHLLISRLETGGTQAELSRPLPPLQRTIVCRELTYAEFRGLENWRVGTMLAAVRSRRLPASSLPRVRLDKLAEIRRGVVIRPAEYVKDYVCHADENYQREPEHYFCVIGPGCLRDGIADCNEAPTACLPQRSRERDGLDMHDILVTIRGSSVQVAQAPCTPRPCIATSNLAVIRPRSKKRDLGLYLLLFLQSQPGLELLQSLSYSPGKSQLNIRYGALGSLEIPMPPEEWLDRLLEDYLIWQDEYAMAAEAFYEVEKRWQERQDHLLRRVETLVSTDGAGAVQETAQPAAEQAQQRGPGEE